MPRDTAKPRDVADYQHHGTGLLRATAERVDVSRWPEPDDPADCRAWMADIWQKPGIASAIRHASPVLAGRVATILTRAQAEDRDVQRVSLAVVRYVLRAQGRPTPLRHLRRRESAVGRRRHAGPVARGAPAGGAGGHPLAP